MNAKASHRPTAADTGVAVRDTYRDGTAGEGAQAPNAALLSSAHTIIQEPKEMTSERLELAAFGRAIRETGPAGLVWFGEDLMWHARTDTANSVVELAQPDGTTGYVRLEGLLSLLAGIGIRRTTIEWKNFPAFYLDRVNGALPPDPK